MRTPRNVLVTVLVAQAVCVVAGFALYVQQSSTAQRTQVERWRRQQLRGALTAWQSRLEAELQAGAEVDVAACERAVAAWPHAELPLLMLDAQGHLQAAAGWSGPAPRPPDGADRDDASRLCSATGEFLVESVPCGPAGWQAAALCGWNDGADVLPPARTRWVLGLSACAWTIGTLVFAGLLLLGRYHNTLRQEHWDALNAALRQAQRLVRTRDGLIFALATLAESRDQETGEHLERISAYATVLARHAATDPRFAVQVPPAFVRMIGLTAALHDIGKVGIEDAILRKPGALTAAERTRMEQHTWIGGQCLGAIARRLGDSGFLAQARDIALGHHERWDGSGYPRGQRGAAIPLAARIVAIADVYDALATRRPYKPPLPHARCVELLVREAGRQFDPALIEIFQLAAPEFEQVAARYRAGPVQPETTPPGEVQREPVPVHE